MQPTFYLYENQDGWQRTSDDLTAEINNHIFGTRDFNCAGRSFYPQWGKPKFKSQTRLAWRLDDEDGVVVRWRWIERTHKAGHRGCKILSGKQCAFRQAAMLRWDDSSNYWVMVQPPNEASETDSKRLDAILKKERER